MQPLKAEAKATGARTVEEVSSVAFGFMGSKALFVALHLGVFDKLRAGPKSVRNLAQACECSASSMQKVVAANVATRLLVPMMRCSYETLTDGVMVQIDQQIWPVLSRLDASLAIKRTSSGPQDAQISSHWYADAMSDPAEAALFTESQHAGSLGAAAFLSKQIELLGVSSAGSPRVLLDIAGGSGAFSISMCKRNKDLKCLLMDFPEVARTASRFVAEARLADRIDCRGGNAISDPWPVHPGAEPDVVLLSYLLSAVQAEEVGIILAKAWVALRPGGQLVIHDFLLDGTASGPAFAALWLFTHEAITPGSPTLTSPSLFEALRKQGFEGSRMCSALPGITSFVFATKPGGISPQATQQRPRDQSSLAAEASAAPRSTDGGRAAAASALGSPFKTSIVVRYSECDMQGVVFNSHYLAWADEAVDQFVRSRLGRKYEADNAFEYMWKKAEVTFHAPARHMDRIDISVAVSRWGNTSFTLSVSGKNQHGEECFSAENVAVCIDRSSQRPTPITDDTKAQLSTGSKL